MEAYLDYLDRLAAEFQEEARSLFASSRDDEANFAKIKVNVCGICKTVYEALQRQTPAAQFERTYLAKLSQFEARWQAAYDREKARSNAEKLPVEESKLKTLQKIKAQYLKLRRQNHAGSGCDQAL